MWVCERQKEAYEKVSRQEIAKSFGGGVWEVIIKLGLEQSMLHG